MRKLLTDSLAKFPAALEALAYMRWYSICSKHYYDRDDCGLCMSGYWMDMRRTWPAFQLKEKP